jgi:hypothetical protein
MKKLLILALLLALPAHCATYVKGYYKSNGTYVQGHYRSNPNSTRLDNYSTRGNINPYTGARGTQDYMKPYRYNTYKPRNNYGYGY